MAKVTKEMLKKLRDEVNAALRPIALSHGVVLAIKDGAYDWKRKSGKLALMVRGLPTKADDINSLSDKETFKHYAPMYGFRPDDLGRRFVSHSRKMEIIGLDLRRKSSPIVTKDVDSGTVCHFGTEVKNLLR